MSKILPIYDIVLDEEDLKQGVGMISLVDEPAIKVNWIKLAEQVSISFKEDKDRQLLYGPFLIPNMLIYRRDDEHGEYYVRFSKEEIDKVSMKFNEDLNSKNINLMHSDVKVDAFVAQNWVIEGEQDKSKALGFDLPEGTWFGAVKIKDNDFWQSIIKTEDVKGFSVEILADLELSLKNKKEKMSKEIKLESVVTADGITIYWDGELIVGTPIFVDEMLTEVAPDKDYALEDGSTIVVLDGLASEIKPKEEIVDEVVEDEGEMEVTPTALTADDVSLMIDSRFSEIMEEITNIKSILDEMTKETNTFKEEVNEKFSLTPAVPSIKKSESKVEEKFQKSIDRVRDFARK